MRCEILADKKCVPNNQLTAPASGQDVIWITHGCEFRIEGLRALDFLSALMSHKIVLKLCRKDVAYGG
jgi:hypothetical protein